MPFIDHNHGFERDIPALIDEWNRRGFSKVSLGTPNDVFAALMEQRGDLPVWEGLLDPAELCYHIARNGKKSAWWLRELCDRELLLAEQLSVMAGLHGYKYPEETLLRCWRDYLTFCTHAIEYLFVDDLEEALFVLEKTIRDARSLQEHALRHLSRDHDAVDSSNLLLYNALPEPRREILSLHILNVHNSRRRPIIKDPRGNPLTGQIVYAGNMARDFEVLVDAELPAGAFSRLTVGWSGEDVTLPREETCPGLDTVIDSGRLSLTFEKGFLTTITDSNTGQQWQASESVCSVFPFVNVHRGRVIREHERANQGKYRRETAGHSPSLSGSIAGCI